MTKWYEDDRGTQTVTRPKYYSRPGNSTSDPGSCFVGVKYTSDRPFQIFQLSVWRRWLKQQKSTYAWVYWRTGKDADDLQCTIVRLKDLWLRAKPVLKNFDVIETIYTAFFEVETNGCWSVSSFGKFGEVCGGHGGEPHYVETVEVGVFGNMRSSSGWTEFNIKHSS